MDNLNQTDKFSHQIFENNTYLFGYSVVHKSVCEVYNYVSPTFRILHFHDGVVEWKIDKELFIFHPGDVVIFNNLHKRNINNVLTGSVTYELYDFIPSCLSNETLRNFFYTRIHRVTSGADTDAGKIYFILNALKQELKRSSDDRFRLMGIQHYLDLLAIEFHRKAEIQNPTMNPSLENITKAIQYIQHHLCDDIKISELADKCGYTPEHFSRIFKKYMGLSPITYIINMRLDNVMHLMSTTSTTILSAAYQSGFQSSSAFYKAFKAYKNTSPSRYVRQYSSNSAE